MFPYRNALLAFPIILTQVRERLPHLKAIVQYKGKLSEAYENVYDVS